MITILRALRFVVPWIFKAAWFAITKFMLPSLASMWTGIPRAVENIASACIYQAAGLHIPSQYESAIFYLASAAAVAMIVVGWVLNAFVTVWIVNLIFRI